MQVFFESTGKKCNWNSIPSSDILQTFLAYPKPTGVSIENIQMSLFYGRHQIPS